MAYVLVVDDDEAIGRLLAMVLQTEGFDCRVVASGQDGLDSVNAEKLALIILDLLLGGMEAGAFIDAVKQDGYEGKVLLCTAISGEPGIEADGLIRKPFEPDDLVAKVRELI